MMDMSRPWGICESGDETTVNLTQGDSKATVKFLQVEKTFTQISDRCVMVLNGKKKLQLQVEARGI